MAESGLPPFEHMSVPQAREVGHAAYVGLQGPGPEVASVVHRFIPGPTADLPVRIYTPEGEGPFGAIPFYHGSGWVILSIETCDSTMRSLANDTCCVVVAVSTRSPCRSTTPGPGSRGWPRTPRS